MAQSEEVSIHSGFPIVHQRRRPAARVPNNANVSLSESALRRQATVAGVKMDTSIIDVDNIFLSPEIYVQIYSPENKEIQSQIEHIVKEMCAICDGSPHTVLSHIDTQIAMLVNSFVEMDVFANIEASITMSRRISNLSLAHSVVLLAWSIQNDRNNLTWKVSIDA